jgi:hypothetical protein
MIKKGARGRADDIYHKMYASSFTEEYKCDHAKKHHTRLRKTTHTLVIVFREEKRG